MHIGLFTVGHNYDQGKKDTQIGEKRYVADVFESLKPTYRHQYNAAQNNVKVFVIAIILLRLYANNLINLISNEYQVGYAKTDLGYSNAEIDEGFTVWSENSET